MNKYLKLSNMWFDGAYCCEVFNSLTNSYRVKRFIGYSKKETLHKLVNKYHVIVPVRYYKKQKQIDAKNLPEPLKIIFSMGFH